MSADKREFYENKDVKDSERDKCEMGVEEATKERQRAIDKEPYS